MIWSNPNTGWWLTYPSEKYEFVSWEYDMPNIWKVIKFMFQTTNQNSFTMKLWKFFTQPAFGSTTLGLFGRLRSCLVRPPEWRLLGLLGIWNHTWKFKMLIQDDTNVYIYIYYICIFIYLFVCIVCLFIYNLAMCIVIYSYSIYLFIQIFTPQKNREVCSITLFVGDVALLLIR